MAALVHEANAKYRMTGNPPVGVARSFHILGAADEEEALTAFSGSAFYEDPLVVGGVSLPLNSATINTTEVDAHEGIWLVEVAWGNETTGSGAPQPGGGQASPSDPGYPKYGFTVSTEQTLVLSSRIAPTTFYPAGIPVESTPAIANGPDGPQGTQIPTPVVNYREVHEISTTDWTAAYRLALAHAVGKVNDAAFAGFATGDVLFMGVEIPDVSNSAPNMLVTFNFAVSEGGDIDLPVYTVGTMDSSEGPPILNATTITVTRTGWQLVDPTQWLFKNPLTGVAEWAVTGYKVHTLFDNVTLATSGPPIAP